jgi:tetratricopeptide (TPR) repeat protein
VETLTSSDLPAPSRTRREELARIGVYLVFAILIAGVLTGYGRLRKDGQSSESIVAQGINAQQVGSPEAAREAYLAALQVDPRDEIALFDLGALYDEGGLVNQARAYYRQALAVDPILVPALFNLAVLEQTARHPKIAISLYERATRVDPPQATAHLELGLLLLANKRTATKGLNELRTALRLNRNLEVRIPASLRHELGTRSVTLTPHVDSN